MAEGVSSLFFANAHDRPEKFQVPAGEQSSSRPPRPPAPVPMTAAIRARRAAGEHRLVPGRLGDHLRARRGRRDVRRNPLVVLLCLELMLNGANLALIAFSRMWGNGDGQIFALIVMTVAACEVTASGSA